MFDLEDAEILRSIIDGVDLGMYVVDRDCRIRFWNAGAEKMTGYPRAEVLGRRSTEDVLHHCSPGPGDSIETSSLRATMEDGEPRRGTVDLRHKDGHRLAVNIKAAAVRNGSGEIIGGVESLGGDHRHAQVAEPRDNSRNPGRVIEAVKLQQQIILYLESMCEQAQQDGSRFGVLKVHIKQLATLQTSHGREATTRLRELVVETLGSALCTRDEIGVWSDDEFLAITSDQNDRGLELEAGRMQSLLQGTTFRWWGDVVPISVAIGGVMAQPEDTAAGLLASAQQALEQSLMRDGNHITILDRWKDGN